MPNSVRACNDRAYELAGGGALQPARVGRNMATQTQAEIRRDDTLWLADQPEDAAERAAALAVTSLRLALNGGAVCRPAFCRAALCALRALALSIADIATAFAMMMARSSRWCSI